MPGERVDVTLCAWTMVFPRLPGVARAHQPTQFDPYEEEVCVVRARRDPADVRGPRTRREAPRRPRRELKQSIKLAPRLAAVVAAVERARLRPRVDRAVCGAEGEREDARLRNRAVDPRPAAVGRPPNAALAQTGVHAVRISWIQGQALSAALTQREFNGPRAVALVEPRDRVSRCGVQTRHLHNLVLRLYSASASS